MISKVFCTLSWFIKKKRTIGHPSIKTCEQNFCFSGVFVHTNDDNDKIVVQGGQSQIMQWNSLLFGKMIVLSRK